MAIQIDPVDTNRRLYVINGNSYYQEELRFIQFRELLDLLEPMWDIISTLFQEEGSKKSKDTTLNLDVKRIIDFLGDDLLKAVAIVIVPEKGLRDRNIDAAVADLEYEKLTLIEEVIVDFFLLNNVRSHIHSGTRIAMALEKDGKSPPGKRSTGPKSSTSSQAETSEKETSSSTKHR